ncbi:MAG: hypothetical protein RLZZ123_1991 [Pseudomonadota bacterium]|jgi:lipid II:glycine glycyltransferase (peptidoglycan interpeptide bridge formation enzyme)
MMLAMEVLWNPLLSQAWARFHHQNAGSLQQAWAYGEALRALGVEVVRAVALENGQWRAAAQFIGRRLLGYISLASCARGPVFDAQTDALWRREFIRRLRTELPVRRLRVPVFSPNQSVLDWDAAQMQGLHRVMTGYSTVMIDLRRPAEGLRADMDGKWRNRLVKAEGNANLKVFFQPSRAVSQSLLDEESKQRRSRGFFGLPLEFVNAYIAAHDRPAQAFRVSWAEHNKRLVAGMLFLLHGRVATYHMGWSDESGRESNAHNILLWRAMQELPACGIDSLDMGGVNTQDLAGISRFKLGAGGQVLTLPGTYF